MGPLNFQLLIRPIRTEPAPVRPMETDFLSCNMHANFLSRSLQRRHRKHRSRLSVFPATRQVRFVSWIPQLRHRKALASIPDCYRKYQRSVRAVSQRSLFAWFPKSETHFSKVSLKAIDTYQFMNEVHCASESTLFSEPT